MWDAETGQERKSFTLKGLSQLSISVCFSPDGKQIAGSGDNGMVKVWNALTGQQELSFKGHAAAVFSVHFSPDGKQIVSSSAEDRTAKVWDAL